MDSNLTKWRSPRTVKRKQFFDDENLPYVNEERFRACEKAGCPAKKPTCCARFDETCAGAGYTSRWYHMSDGEHFCNACFDYMYRSCKDGYETYTNWKYDWSASGQREASVKVYVSEMIMPFWVQCTLCSKWREFPQQQFSTEDIKTWKCTSSIIDVVKTKTKVKRKAVIPCSIEEDERVSAVNCAGWLESLTEPPLLQSCPAAPFLSSYFPDGVGLSPTINNWKQNDSTSTGYVNLFHHPEDTQTALTFRPDIMEKEEIEAFPEFARYPMVYLALRNLVLSLWMLNHKEFLTPEKCAHRIILRGLVRVLMVAEVRRVLFFLGKKGIVNHGILPDVPKTLPSTQDSKVSVIVIGAGAAGLSAARHLDNFGVQAIIVESRDRIGGRVWDDKKMFGCCVGRGAQILNGCTNNPISVLCEQSGLTMHHIGSKCDLLMEDGSCVDGSIDSKVEFHFNALLDAIADQKRDSPNNDKSLEGSHSVFNYSVGDLGATNKTSLFYFIVDPYITLSFIFNGAIRLVLIANILLLKNVEVKAQ